MRSPGSMQFSWEFFTTSESGAADLSPQHRSDLGKLLAEIRLLVKWHPAVPYCESALAWLRRAPSGSESVVPGVVSEDPKPGKVSLTVD